MPRFLLFFFFPIVDAAPRSVLLPLPSPFPSPSPFLPPSPSTWATFSNTSSSLLLSTPRFALALSAATGSLASLTHPPTDEVLFYGSAFGQLWALVGPTGSLNNNALPFTWSWAQAADGGGALTLNWARPGGGERIRVTITAPALASWCDMAFELLSPPLPSASPLRWDSLWFPSMPLFNTSNSKAGVFFPVLPGLTLNASFFAAGVAANLPYPGSGVFADLLHVNASGSAATVSLFTITGPTYTTPHYKGLYPAPASGSGLWRYAHSIQPVNVTGGCDVSNGGWGGGDGRPAGVPPPCGLGLKGGVRVRLAIGGSAFDAVQLYGVSNGLLAPPASWPATPGLTPHAAAPLPPLLSKLAGNTTLLRALARATLVKVDAIGLGLNFSEYPTVLLPALLPLGGGLLVHTVAWEPIAFDHYYPDLLPPNTRFGTGCDLQAALGAVRAAGHLVMPYSNPTWWDPTAPTLSRLPQGLTLASVATLNATLQPTYETYADVPPATGIVTELAHPFVTARIRALLCQLNDALTWPDCATSSNKLAAVSGECNETAVRLPNDIVFEDQLGARSAYADTHPLQAGLGALAFQDALQRHAANVTGAGAWQGSGVLLGTEQGYDRMAAANVGFFGNNIELNPTGWPFYGANWTPMPAAGLLFGESILYSVHNLATTAFARTLPNACWALAAGSRLSVDGVSAYWNRGELPWLASVTAMQRIVASQWTGYALSSYTDLLAAEAAGGEPLTVGTGASLTQFTNMNTATPLLFPGASDTYSVVTNWANADPLDVDIGSVAAGGGVLSSPATSFSLPPRSCLAFGASGDVLGGWVTSWRGRVLPPAPGSHFVVEDRNCLFAGVRGVCLRHGLGSDTPLEIAPLGGACSSKPSPVCTAVAVGGGALGGVPCACVGGGGATGGLLTVAWTSTVNGTSVDFVFIPTTAASTGAPTSGLSPGAIAGAVAGSLAGAAAAAGGL